jgi:hypothetical protein
MNLVQKLQKNRFAWFARQLQGAPVGGESQADPQKFEALLNQVSSNGQEQNAAGAPGALQKERGEEGGRQRDVGQREEEGRPRQGPKVQRTEEEDSKDKNEVVFSNTLNNKLCLRINILLTVVTLKLLLAGNKYVSPEILNPLKSKG